MLILRVKVYLGRILHTCKSKITFSVTYLIVFQIDQILGSFIVIRIGYVDNSFINIVQQEKEQKA